MADAAKAKRPMSGYFMWLNGNREAITKAAGGSNVKLFAGKASEMWKAMSEGDKAPWMAKASKAKEEHAKFLGTDEGKSAMMAKKAGVKELTEEEKSALQDNRAKRPMSGYFLWLNGNREAITKAAGGSNAKVFAGKAAEMWKAMSEGDKAPWMAKATKAKEVYEAFMASDEGKAILDAKKNVGKRKREAKGKKAAKKAKKNGDAEGADEDEEEEDDDEEEQ